MRGWAILAAMCVLPLYHTSRIPSWAVPLSLCVCAVSLSSLPDTGRPNSTRSAADHFLVYSWVDGVSIFTALPFPSLPFLSPPQPCHGNLHSRPYGFPSVQIRLHVAKPNTGTCSDRSNSILKRHSTPCYDKRSRSESEHPRFFFLAEQAVIHVNHRFEPPSQFLPPDVPRSADIKVFTGVARLPKAASAKMSGRPRFAGDPAAGRQSLALILQRR